MSAAATGVLSANWPNESAEPCYKLSFRLESPRTKGPSRMSTNEVTLSIDDRVAVVEMHRPPANFFDRDLLAVIADAGEEAQSAGARAIVLCSKGRHFCAGLNLNDRFGQLDPRDAAAPAEQPGFARAVTGERAPLMLARRRDPEHTAADTDVCLARVAPAHWRTPVVDAVPGSVQPAR